jgi:hypothetical protein
MNKTERRKEIERERGGDPKHTCLDKETNNWRLEKSLKLKAKHTCSVLVHLIRTW